jgi:cysteine synthase
MIYDSILGTIGRTPIVRINRLAPAHVTMYVKCEFFNPLSSVKDRLAIAIIEDAERRGTIKPGQTVVEATSGNTGIALAMVCAAKGYPFVAIMAESFSVERRKIMRMLGARVILTPAAERGSGMVRKAEELAKKHGWFLARQFENEANPEYHRNTTGPEILSDFAGKRLDFWVTGWGTGGTLTGAGEMIRRARPDVRIVVSEPEGAALLSGREFKPHKIQGSGRRRRSHRDGALARAQRRHLQRHFFGRHLRRGDESGGQSAQGFRDPRDAAGHRGTLPLDAAVRGNCRRWRSGAVRRSSQRAAFNHTHLDDILIAQTHSQCRSSRRACSHPAHFLNCACRRSPQSCWWSRGSWATEARRAQPRPSVAGPPARPWDLEADSAPG